MKPHRPLLQPVPGDSIVGFISRGRGVIVHTATSGTFRSGARSPRFPCSGTATRRSPSGAHPYHGPQPEGLAGGHRHRAARRGRQHRRLSLAGAGGRRSEMEMVVQVRDVAHLTMSSTGCVICLRSEVLRKTANEEVARRGSFPNHFPRSARFVLLLNVITLPANWIMLGLIGLWRLLIPPRRHGRFSPCLSALPYLGKSSSTSLARLGARNGSSTSGMWAGLLGALVGALAGLPCCLALARSSARSWARGSCYRGRLSHGC